MTQSYILAKNGVILRFIYDKSTTDVTVSKGSKVTITYINSNDKADKICGKIKQICLVDGLTTNDKLVFKIGGVSDTIIPFSKMLSVIYIEGGIDGSNDIETIPIENTELVAFESLTPTQVEQLKQKGDPGGVWGSLKEIPVRNNNYFLSNNAEGVFQEIGMKLSKNAIRTIGIDPSANYICDGIKDDYEFQCAINDLLSFGGGSIYVLPGTYHFSKHIILESNIKIEIAKSARIVMDDQVSSIISNTVNIGTDTITIPIEDISKFQIGMIIGILSDSTTGYRTDGETAEIASINNNVITLTKPVTSRYLANTGMIVSVNSCFTAIDGPNRILHDIEIVGGEIDGNEENTKVWIKDLYQNGIISGGVTGLKLRNVAVHGFKFQAIHLSGTIATGSNIGAIIDECCAYDNGSSGICVDSVTDNVFVVNCIGYNNSNSGLQMVATSNCTVMGGIYKNNSFCGIRSAHDELINKNNKIIGAICENNGRGIGVRNNVGLIISNCSTEANTDCGVYLEEDCKNTQITNCNFSNEKLGINESNIGTSDNVFVNPVFINCTTKYSLSSGATLITMSNGNVDTNKMLTINNRFRVNASNNHFQFGEGGVTKWHIESVNGVLSIVESGVAERLVIDKNLASLNAKLKVSQGLGCNGKDPQTSVELNTELSTTLTAVSVNELNKTNELLNQIRAALINCGICS